MTRTCLSLLVAIAVSASCERRRGPDPQSMVRKTLHGVLVYPQSVTIDVAAGEEAAQVTLTSKDPPERVARWFRQSLSLNGWTVESDLTNRDGSIAIVAIKGEQPLWLSLRPTEGGEGTTYLVIGADVAGPDSTAVADSSR
ncbi:MAG: hypothetical protein ACREMF_01300 [Gemmatimonadales bacterium]